MAFKLYFQAFSFVKYGVLPIPDRSNAAYVSKVEDAIPKGLRNISQIFITEEAEVNGRLSPFKILNHLKSLKNTFESHILIHHFPLQFDLTQFPYLFRNHIKLNWFIWISIFLALYISLNILVAIRKRVTFRNFSRRNGCYPMQIAPNPFGGKIRRYFEFSKVNANILDDYLLAKYQRNGWTHGFASYWTGKIKGIATVEPENFQAVLATSFDDWERPRFRAKAISPLLGPGILTLDGAPWAHSRKLIKSKFTRQRMENNLLNNQKHIDHLFLALPEHGDDGWTPFEEIYSVFSRFAMDTSTDFLYGISAGTQACHLVREGKLMANSATISMDGFENAFKKAQGHIAVRMRLGSSYWWHDGPSYRIAVHRLVSIMNTYLKDAIVVAKDNLAINNGVAQNVLEAFVAEEKPFSWISNQARHLIIAGFETTSSLLGFSFGLLAEHPDVFETLRATILEDFGTESQPKQAITFESLKNCKYLQYFISETLRLYPGGANIQRVAAKNTVLPKGGGLNRDQPIAVPRGSTVNISIYVAHRRKDVWGEDASAFKPERWIDRKKGYSYIPFIAGPQICIGQQYSMTQAAYVLVKCLRRFDKIERPAGANNLALGWMTVLAPGEGTTVRVHRASDDE